ncbi:MAG: hypothetical protein PV362_14290, partial [Providencia heimbachae]|nr:hypothetical protein [Providencia heimbachae]
LLISYFIRWESAEQLLAPIVVDPSNNPVRDLLGGLRAQSSKLALNNNERAEELPARVYTERYSLIIHWDIVQNTFI